MKMIRFTVLFLGLVFLAGCGGGRDSHVRLAIDPNWYPLDFGPQLPFVNGFVEELLIDMAAYSGLSFERIEANWDTLLDDLQQKKYDAVISSLPPYSFNLARYDFSESLLDLGPTLIVSVASPHSSLDEMQGELVGLLAGDATLSQVQKAPQVILRTYPSVPDLLNALVLGEIEGAVLDRILANAYIKDLYAGKLALAGPAITDAGLRLVTLKGKYPHLIKVFNQDLDSFKKKKKLSALLSKWQLAFRVVH
jgi:polar amino acid transport system substrate-binding protein